MKSVKVFILASCLPCSYHVRPSSPPPRIWAIAYTMPRSSNERRDTAKPGSMDASYDPYPYSRAGAEPSSGTSARRTIDNGTWVPSAAVAQPRSWM